MRVFCSKTAREAQWRKSKDGREGYFATPSGENETSEAMYFPSIEALAVFLIRNPTWKVYVGDAQINGTIVVEGIIPLEKLK